MVNETFSGRNGDESAPASPRSRVKFLVSHGGKILPRPGDGQLKYVGGETRVLAVPGDIMFSELMKKLSTIVEGEMVLKYQVIPDDLEALVSVRSDEDVKHMLDEYQRHESEGTSKLRAFLFPSSPVIAENPVSPVDPFIIEQRYIDAINGIVRPAFSGRFSRNSSKRQYFSISGHSTPKSASPDAKTGDFISPFEHVLTNQESRIGGMHRVHSSPTLHTHSPNNTIPHQSSNLGNHNFYQHHHHYNQGHQQSQHYAAGYQSSTSRLHQDPRFDRLKPLSLGKHDFARIGFGHGQVPSNQFHSRGRPSPGNGDGSSYSAHDCLLVSRNRRPDSAPMSPHNIWD